MVWVWVWVWVWVSSTHTHTHTHQAPTPTTHVGYPYPRQSLIPPKKCKSAQVKPHAALCSKTEAWFTISGNHAPEHSTFGTWCSPIFTHFHTDFQSSIPAWYFLDSISISFDYSNPLLFEGENKQVCGCTATVLHNHVPLVFRTFAL